MLDLVSNAGGFLNGVFKGLAIFTGLFCSVLANSKLLHMMLQESLESYKQKDEMKRLINSLQGCGFQTRMFF